MDLSQVIVNISLPGQGYEIGLDWLGHFARIIIEGVGIVGLGIIVFTLVLKAITLPFDIYQRVKMRKQNLIMREMQPELEKLQKQYANDKAMYNQKMVELQKKSGYSILGACLPMIISLVILIVAFSGFRTYSQYANLNLFMHMSEQYNAAILESSTEGKEYRLKTEGDTDELALDFAENTSFEADGVRYTMFYLQKDKLVDGNRVIENGSFVTEPDTDKPYMRVESTDTAKYVYYVYPMKNPSAREYRIDAERLYAVTQDEALKARIDENRPNAEDTTENAVLARRGKLESACRGPVVDIGAKAAAEYFRSDEGSPSFLWIKNVWYPDVSYDHPIPTYSEFRDQLNEEVTLPNGETRSVSEVLTESQYENLTLQLAEEKDAANGYFILIILSILLMIGSQLIVMKSSKEANKYQTVDGQGARTQKVMLVVMPLIYALFAFMYSAAFSIYMCMSSVVAILVTVFSNLILGRIFEKKEEEAFREQHTRVLPWMQQQDGGKDGKKKKK